MSLRKTWITVLLGEHNISPGERFLYSRALSRMSESEAHEVVLLLERSLESGVADSENSFEKAKVLLTMKCVELE